VNPFCPVIKTGVKTPPRQGAKITFSSNDVPATAMNPMSEEFLGNNNIIYYKALR
jgi:hypothetical protein